MFMNETNTNSPKLPASEVSPSTSNVHNATCSSEKPLRADVIYQTQRNYLMLTPTAACTFCPARFVATYFNHRSPRTPRVFKLIDLAEDTRELLLKILTEQGVAIATYSWVLFVGWGMAAVKESIRKMEGEIKRGHEDTNDIRKARRKMVNAEVDFMKICMERAERVVAAKQERSVVTSGDKPTRGNISARDMNYRLDTPSTGSALTKEKIKEKEKYLDRKSRKENISKLSKSIASSPGDLDSDYRIDTDQSRPVLRQKDRKPNSVISEGTRNSAIGVDAKVSENPSSKATSKKRKRVSPATVTKAIKSLPTTTSIPNIHLSPSDMSVRGRPPVYATPEDAKRAKREKTCLRVSKFRLRKQQAPIQRWRGRLGTRQGVEVRQNY